MAAVTLCVRGVGGNATRSRRLAIPLSRGLRAWHLIGLDGELGQFQVVKDGNNFVLAGENGFLGLKDGFWRDYASRCA